MRQRPLLAAIGGDCSLLQGNAALLPAVDNPATNGGGRFATIGDFYYYYKRRRRLLRTASGFATTDGGQAAVLHAEDGGAM